MHVVKTTLYYGDWTLIDFLIQKRKQRRCSKPSLI